MKGSWVGRWSGMWLMALVSMVWGGPLHAERVEPSLWGTEPGPAVTAIARSGNTIYIGGSFGTVGPCTGGGVPLNLTDGAILPFPSITGPVGAAVEDGEGGWFLGGGFSGIGGTPRSGLAHVLADGRLSDWAPQVDAGRSVDRMVLEGGRLYVAGTFRSINAVGRNYLAALDPTTGSLLAWNPNPDSYVWALAPIGDALFVGGEFHSVGGQARSYIAAVDTVEGMATSWNPGANRTVRALHVSNGVLYIGGYFTSIGGQPRSLAAGIDLATGAVTDFDPNGSGNTNPYLRPPRVETLASSGNTIYAGGIFTTIGGQARNGIAALDAMTGSATSWDPNSPDLGCYIYTIVIHDNAAYVGGIITNLGGQARSNIAAVNLSTASATPWNPRANQAVYSLTLGTSSMFAGGAFTSMWGWERRHGLAALDATTGALLTWNPNPNGSVVTTLGVRGNTVYAGGDFTVIGGEERHGIAALDTDTGATTSWNPNADGPVLTLTVRDTTIYVGGNFNTIGGQTRNHLATLGAASGLAGSWNPQANGSVNAMVFRGDTVYVGGSFSRFGGGGPGGVTRNSLASLDAVSGSLTPWNPDGDGVVYALAVNGERVYAGGLFLNVGGQTRSGIAALDATTGLASHWNPNPSPSEVYYPEIYSLAVVETTVYAGGLFSAMGGELRNGFAAIGATSGVATNWNPKTDGAVWALSLSGDTLYAGGRFGMMGGYPKTNLAAIILPKSRVIPKATMLHVAQNVPNPARNSAAIEFSIPVAGTVTLDFYDLQGRRIARLLDHEPRTAGPHAVIVRTGTWRPGCYLYRLEVNGESASRKMLVVK